MKVTRRLTARKRKPSAEYSGPLSPFQKLIEFNRLKLGISYRDLAERIGTDRSTLWIWIHTSNGTPHAKSFNSSHLKALSKTLKISHNELEQAFDASRLMYTQPEIAPQAPEIDLFKEYIEVIKADRRIRIPKTYLLAVAEKFYDHSKKAK